MLEVLVSVVILSFGLLGMAGLHAVSMKASRESQLQSTAVLLAREYAELMRNNNQVASRRENNPYLIAPDDAVDARAQACHGGRGCDSLALAAWDRSDWLSRVRHAMPQAVVQVCFDDAPFESSGQDAGQPRPFSAACSNQGDTVVVKIGWPEITGQAGADGSYSRAMAQALRPAIVLPVAPGGADAAGAVT